MTAEVSAVTSRNGKLNTDMTLESVREGSYKSERAKNKAISIFVKADKNNDGQLDADEIKAYDRKQTLKTIGLIAGGIALAGLSAFAVTKYMRTSNLKNLGELIGENKKGLKLYKKVGQEGEEVLTTVDGHTGKVLKKISKSPNPNPYSWMPDNMRYSFSPTNAKSQIVHIEDYRTGETIDRVRSNWNTNNVRNFNVDTVYSKGGKITKLTSTNGVPGLSRLVVNTPGNTPEELALNWMFKGQTCPADSVISDKYLLEKFNITKDMNEGLWTV